jgi:hypothetical protein
VVPFRSTPFDTGLFADADDGTCADLSSGPDGSGQSSPPGLSVRFLSSFGDDVSVLLAVIVVVTPWPLRPSKTGAAGLTEPFLGGAALLLKLRPGRGFDLRRLNRPSRPGRRLVLG